MPSYDGKIEFIKVAVARLRDADELFQQPTLSPHESGADTRHLRSAMYLAGYSVECILKAYIISQEKVSTLTEALDKRRANGEQIPNIMGVDGHNLTLLLFLAGNGLNAQLESGKQIKEVWGTCRKWNSSWRYDPVHPSRKDAEAFILAVRRVHKWVKIRI